MKKILLIEDDTDLFALLKYNLEKEGYLVVGSQTGRGAVEMVRQERPDLIILDIMLPDTDGWELLRLLRESPATRSVPVIVCSVVREADLASALGAMQYLSKPVRRQDLLQALDRAVQLATAGERKAQGHS